MPLLTINGLLAGVCDARAHKQPIDINFLRKDKGGDPDFWRENQRKRFQDPALVDLVIQLDEVSGPCCAL